MCKFSFISCFFFSKESVALKSYFILYRLYSHIRLSYRELFFKMDIFKYFEIIGVGIILLSDFLRFQHFPDKIILPCITPQITSLNLISERLSNLHKTEFNLPPLSLYYFSQAHAWYFVVVSILQAMHPFRMTILPQMNVQIYP